jgi:hypothetical protein
MLDREKVVAVLKHRFPGAAAEQVAAATNAIVGLPDEWVELPAPFVEPDGQRLSVCDRSCYLAEAAGPGSRFKVFQRVEDTDDS